MYQNQFSYILGIIDWYKKMVVDALKNNYKKSLSDDTINKILLDLDPDRWLFLSLNKQYKEWLNFSEFVTKEKLDSELLSCFSYVDKLFAHQERAINNILENRNTIISTWTWSWKTESFLIPIIDYCLKTKNEKWLKAIIIYPMKALANDQIWRLEKILENTNITYAILDADSPKNNDIASSNNKILSKSEIISKIPNILITNYVMLERVLTNSEYSNFWEKSKNTFKFTVLDEIHTYRWNKAFDISWLLKRLKFISESDIKFIWSSATIKSSSNTNEDWYIQMEKEEIEKYASNLLGINNFIYETDFIWADYFNIVSLYSWKNEIPIISNIDSLLNVKIENKDPWDTIIYNIFNTLFNQNTHDKKGIYDYLINSKLISELNIFLFNWPKSLSNSDNDIVGFIKKLFYKSNQSINFTKLTELLFILIVYINYVFENKHSAGNITPLLDFKAHVFLKNINWKLRKCLKCWTYWTWDEDLCLKCWNILFDVYCKDINQVIWKLVFKINEDWKNISTLSNNLFHEKWINEIYVLISKWEEHSFMKVDDLYEIFFGDKNINNCFTCNIEELDDFDYRFDLDSWEYFINLYDNFVSWIKNERYIFSLTKKLFDFSETRKLLAFIDNKELATYYKLCLNENFVSIFFEHLFIYYLSKNWWIDNTINTIKELFYDNIELFNENDKTVFKEFDYWLVKYIKNSLKSWTINFKDNNYTENEYQILKVFLIEGIINNSIKNKNDNKYIIFDLYDVYFAKAIKLWIWDNESQDDTQNVLSFNSNCQKYKKLIEQIWDSNLSQIFNNLIKKGYIINKENSENLFYLNHNKLEFNTNYIEKIINPLSEFFEDNNFVDTFKKLKSKFHIEWESHFWDLDWIQRKDIEQKFKSNKLDFLIATSTLEMWIDIWDLRNCLLIWVPLTPSSYIQRVWRVWRNKNSNNWYSLATIFCRPKNSHDLYYYNSPLEIISWEISPPEINLWNKKIINKHLMALIYYYKNNQEKIQQIDSDYNIGEDLINTIMSEINYKSPEALYNEKKFPDYWFSKNQVYLNLKSDNNGLSNKENRNKNHLASRDYESAITKFIPNTSYFIWKPYKITEIWEYETLSNLILYNYFVAEPSSNITKNDIIKKQWFHYSILLNWCLNSEIIWIKYHLLEHKELYLINDTFVFADKNHDTKKLWYKLNDISWILFEFDSEINDSYILSFWWIIDRYFKKIKKIDEAEIKFITNITVVWNPIDNSKYILLYEWSWNWNISFWEFYNNFPSLLNKMLDFVIKCNCNDWCYKCMKSFNNISQADKISKVKWIDMLNFLLKKDIKTILSESPPLLNCKCLTLEVNFKKDTLFLEIKDWFNSLLKEEIKIYSNEVSVPMFKWVSLFLSKFTKIHNEKFTLSINSNKNLYQYVNNKWKSKDLMHSRKLYLELLKFEKITW